MPHHKTISIVVPVFNEERNIRPLFEMLVRILVATPYGREIVFVDDGSTDGSVAVLERIAEGDPSVRVVQLARNFGKEIATTAGVHHCTGDACILIDADLQHPVETIPEFLRRWEGGAEVVVGVREGSGGASWSRRLGSRAYYAIINAISDTGITPNATDFRLIDRVVIDEFNRFTEKTRMTRALIDWLGFRREYVPFTANPRRDGRPRYGTVKLVRLALSSFVSHSLFPLKIGGYLGVFITVASGLLGAFILVEKYLLGDPLGLHFSGPAILAVINLFLVGIVLSCLGIIALYIANIHGEVINRPLYAVRRRKDRGDGV